MFVMCRGVILLMWYFMFILVLFLVVRYVGGVCIFNILLNLFYIFLFGEKFENFEGYIRIFILFFI